MAKRKQDGSRRPAAGDPAQPVAAGGEPVPPDAPLRFEMPFPASAPQLVNPGLGLAGLVGRVGRDFTYTMDVTVLDAPDHRLLRSGVLVAHRVVGERGEWYLAAPRWSPLMPTERSEPMGSGDLPEGLAAVIRPFRRRAPLGPVAALNCDRREFEFRDGDGRGRCLLRDEKVTVRRAGVTIARYREVTLTPSGPGLTPEQRAWLADRLTGAGGTAVEAFPLLVTRLGAPATGLTDFPEVDPPADDLPFGTFVARWLAVRLRALVAADLRLSGSEDDQTGSLLATELVTEAERLRDEAEALSGVLDTDWISDLDDELDWVIEQPDVGAEADPARTVAGLRARLRGERYLTVLDQLVNAVRAPKVGDLTWLPAADVIGAVLESARVDAAAAAEQLDADSEDAEWGRAAQALDGYHRALRLAEIAGADRSQRERRRLDKARTALAVVTDRARRTERLRDQAVSAEPERAFGLGRRYERQLRELAADRAEFLRRWSKLIKKAG